MISIHSWHSRGTFVRSVTKKNVVTDRRFAPTMSNKTVICLGNVSFVRQQVRLVTGVTDGPYERKR